MITALSRPSPDHVDKLRPQKSRIIFVEGIDDARVVEALCRLENRQDDVQIVPFAERGRLGDLLVLFVKDSGFQVVSCIALTKDADDDPAGAGQSLVESWARARAAAQELQVPEPRSHFFVLPDDQTRGNLETLCLRAPSFPEVMRCAEEMFECAKNAGRNPSNREKAIASAYLSMMDESVVNLGIAALRGYWNLRSEAFRPLREFVSAFLR